jgi:hypothetical protein
MQDVLGSAWWNFKNVRLPVFLGRDQAPSATVCIARVYTDHERRGFFKIGALPVLAADDVSFELTRPSVLSNALSVAHSWLRPPKAAFHVEMRQVSFRLTPESSPRLEAGVVRCLGDGTWELTRQVCFLHGSNHIILSRAILHVAGPATGVVEWNEGGTNTLTINLFSELSPK